MQNDNVKSQNTSVDDLQDKIFQKMGGSERVRSAFAFSDLIRKIAEDGVRDQYPHFSRKDLRKELVRRMSLSNKAWKNKRKFSEK